MATPRRTRAQEPRRPARQTAAMASSARATVSAGPWEGIQVQSRSRTACVAVISASLCGLGSGTGHSVKGRAYGGVCAMPGLRDLPVAGELPAGVADSAGLPRRRTAPLAGEVPECGDDVATVHLAQIGR